MGLQNLLKTRLAGWLAFAFLLASLLGPVGVGTTTLPTGGALDTPCVSWNSGITG